MHLMSKVCYLKKLVKQRYVRIYDLGETVFEIGTIAPQGAGAAVVLS